MIHSFRDPSGKTYILEDIVVRQINQEGFSDFETATQSEILRNFVDAGQLISFRNLDSSQQSLYKKQLEIPEKDLIVEHPKIDFPAYPYEWSPQMLYAAAKLTLDLAQKLLTEGIGLKDASPYNILFSFNNPVFVDWLSFEKRNPLDYIWTAQAQFVRTFLLPLLVNKHFGLRLNQIFISERDGLEPEKVYEMCSSLQRISPAFFSLVTLPKLFSKKDETFSGIYEKRLMDSPEKAAFIINRQFRQLEKWLENARPALEKTSEWTEYIGDKQHFTAEYLEQKRRFVEETLNEYSFTKILDVGCNTGFFSRIAAQSGADVVAIDADSAVIDKVWQLAIKEKLKILPLAVDYSRPSPAIGWKNNECASFIKRASGKFDLVMMLAVVHHLLVSEGIPLDEIIKSCAEMTKDKAIIEFVAPQDKMFRKIARGRDFLYQNLTEEVFEAVCQKYFRILRKEKTNESNRSLYLMQK